jgi:hypothetical protein
VWAMVLKRTIKSIHTRGGGYLFCNYCGGYYKLKESESPRDYVKCECGNPLEFCKTDKELELKSYNLSQNKEVYDSFQTRIFKRRESLKNFFPTIEIEDDYIDEELSEKEELWDVIDREINVINQKKYLNIILEQERLMTIIQEKKGRVKNPSLMEKLILFYEETDPLIILGMIIIILITVLILAVFRG